MRAEFVQRAGVDTTFEVNDIVDGAPEINPAPSVEFGLVGTIQSDALVVTQEPQHKPALFLANTQRRAASTDVTVGQAIAQPVLGTAKDLDIGRVEAHLFVKLPEHGLLRAFVLVHAALRKLPTLFAYASCEQQLALAVRQYNADVGAVAFRIYVLSAHKSSNDCARILYSGKKAFLDPE